MTVDSLTTGGRPGGTDSLGTTIIAVAIVWAGVILAATVVLQGTEYFSQLLPILGGGAAMTIILLGGFRNRGQQGHQRS